MAAYAAFAPQTRVHGHKRKSRVFTANILGWLVFMGSPSALMSSTIGPCRPLRGVEARRRCGYRGGMGVAFVSVAGRQGLVMGGRVDISSAMVTGALQTCLTGAKLHAPHGGMEARQTGCTPGAHWIDAQSEIAAPLRAGVKPFGEAEKHDDADV